ncbi:NAD(P)H-dependent oxidoreductase [Ectothiorhodospiraceae bacterium 2226]|nr:NAD(P)H-dependent oxidoreductase [Ectothiorhodospiraceae bacterium 2226]
MGRRIVIIQGHPDPAGGHLDHALARAYAEGAGAAGHAVRVIEVATLEFSWLRSQREWTEDPPPPGIAEAQRTVQWADHLLIVYPLWLGAMPARLKGFLEHLLRPGFAVGDYRAGHLPRKLLKGRSARVVVTMGMPALVYRWYYRAHGLKYLRRNILGFCGIGPIRVTLIGGVGALSTARAARWLGRLRALGEGAR